MKTALLLSLIACAAFGQKTKTIEIADVAKVSISCFVRYNESNVPTDTSYYMYGVNDKYKSIVDIVSLKKGDIYEIQRLVKKCLEASKEDDGTTFDFEGSFIGVFKTMGINAVVLYGQDDDSDGYVELSANQINKLLAKIEEHISTIKK